MGTAKSRYCANISYLEHVMTSANSSVNHRSLYHSAGDPCKRPQYLGPPPLGTLDLDAERYEQRMRHMCQRLNRMTIQIMLCRHPLLFSTTSRVDTAQRKQTT